MFGDERQLIVLLGTFMEKALRLCSKFCVCVLGRGRIEYGFMMDSL